MAKPHQEKHEKIHAQAYPDDGLRPSSPVEFANEVGRQESKRIHQQSGWNHEPAQIDKLGDALSCRPIRGRTTIPLLATTY